MRVLPSLHFLMSWALIVAEGRGVDTYDYGRKGGLEGDKLLLLLL